MLQFERAQRRLEHFGPGGGGGGGGGAVTFTEEIQTLIDAEAATDITLAALANGSARSSAAIVNPDQRAASMVYLTIMSGAVAPTSGAVYEVYFLQRNAANTIGTDGWAGANAAITIINATLIGTIAVTANANTTFHGIFSTPRDIPLGASWGIAVRNASGQALHGTEGNHLKRTAMYVSLMIP